MSRGEELARRSFACRMGAKGWPGVAPSRRTAFNGFGRGHGSEQAADHWEER
jgi:hypothetical protein